ncbi:MAG: hypothetical protein HY671_13370 [Chloroflexi bacterium]|nr:hypothetical protein [Chloroflexota bacterium]
MKSVTQMKSLGDMRTIISTHARSTPHETGSTYLEVYLLDKERQRLETEMSMLNKRQGRIQGRLDEISKAVEELVAARRAATSEGQAKGCIDGKSQVRAGSGAGPGRLVKVNVEY